MTDIPNNHSAVTLEAMVAAREIKAHPFTARGGPWCNKVLRAQQNVEISEVARCQTISEVLAVRDKLPWGSLHEHLANIKFSQPEPASSSSAKPAKPAATGKSAAKAQPKQCIGAPARLRLPDHAWNEVQIQIGTLVRKKPSGDAYRKSIGQHWGKKGFKEMKFDKSDPAGAHNESTKRWRRKQKPMKTMKAMKVMKAMKAMK